MIWFDSPSNPLLKIVDIKAVVDMARKKNPKTLVIVDNTFATGYFQRPLDFGADIVMNSLTKYLNGHSDVIMVDIFTIIYLNNCCLFVLINIF